MDQSTLDDLTINTIRTLAMDAVQQAHSGHPGTPMALAPVVYTLWQRFLRFDPNDPIWPNRDRFALSVGHASMLLYAMLYLTGVKAVDADYERLGEPSVTLEDIKRFRQLGSKCPGHPEYHLTSGAETTTGPLGQGVANSVGMAIAERWADEIERMQRRELPEGWDADLSVFPADAKGLASREASGTTLNAIARHHPWLIGGAADSPPRPGPGSNSAALAILRRRITVGAISTLASASMRWALSSTGLLFRRFAFTARAF